MLRTRGKRVVAEASSPNELSRSTCTRRSDKMFRARQVSNLGGFMSGVNNNGAHSSNGITAMFIATGQDVANVAESSAAFVFAELPRERRLLLLGHDPVADRRHLRRRDRPGDPARVPRGARLLRQDKVRKFAEIVAATVLCGELSLGSAIVAEEWVEAHDLLGRNRP